MSQRETESAVHLKVVVIGGGTGNSTLLSGLKSFVGDGLTSVVSMTDDGGSTRMLRDEYGALPPGDVRQCLVALSNRPDLWRDIFNYRYAPGSSNSEGDLRGVNVGNIMIAAAEDIIKQKHIDKTKPTAGMLEAVQLMGDILDITGRVIPVTSADRRLVLTLPDGQIIRGEHQAEETQLPSLKGARVDFDKRPTRITAEAAAAIANADVTVIAPGDLYTSIAPALAVDGMREALQSTKQVVLVCNLMNRNRHTVGFTVSDYASEVERIIGDEVLDYAIYNNQEPAPAVLKRYAAEGEHLVRADTQVISGAHYTGVPKPLISRQAVVIDPNDILGATRSLVRHDQIETARALMAIAFSDGKGNA